MLTALALTGLACALLGAFGLALAVAIALAPSSVVNLPPRRSRS